VSQLNGIGTLLQPNDRPVLSCPPVSLTWQFSYGNPAQTPLHGELTSCR